MRVHNQNNWGEFNPLTNVIVRNTQRNAHIIVLMFKRLQWLHYLAKKLLHSKGLRKPPAKRNVDPPPAPSPELEAWQSLTTVEALLAQSIASLTLAATASSSKKGRRKGKGGTAIGGSASMSTSVPTFSCAGSVVDEGLKWGLYTV